MFATAAAELKYSCKMNKESENTHGKKSNKRKNKTTFLSSVFHKKQKRCRSAAAAKKFAICKIGTLCIAV
jgi:hypothetical protein